NIITEAEINRVDFKSKQYVRLSATTGLMVRLFGRRTVRGYLYAGAGYGIYGAAYRINASRYFCPDLQKGIEAEGGVILSVWHLHLSAGYSTLFSDSPQRFGDMHVGVGINFN
ncbi:MAG: hypothetical protein LBV39_05300, partial [Bacteroidales bacterium]|nr:hypothetical protein [Bacteroidales bacterium]